jgi:hypothetical protein
MAGGEEDLPVVLVLSRGIFDLYDITFHDPGLLSAPAGLYLLLKNDARLTAQNSRHRQSDPRFSLHASVTFD